MRSTIEEESKNERGRHHRGAEHLSCRRSLRWARAHLLGDSTPESEIREGFQAIAERETRHAHLLTERIQALGAEVGPSCLDDFLGQFIAQAEETEETSARFQLIVALVGGAVTEGPLAMCGQAVKTAFENGDPETRRLLEGIFVEEKLTGEWCAQHCPDLRTLADRDLERLTAPPANR